MTRIEHAPGERRGGPRSMPPCRAQEMTVLRRGSTCTPSGETMTFRSRSTRYLTMQRAVTLVRMNAKESPLVKCRTAIESRGRRNACLSLSTAVASLLLLICAPAVSAQTTGTVGVDSAAPAQPPSAGNADSSQPQPGGPIAPDNEQYDKLAEAQKRYQQLAGGEGLPKVPGGETMSPGSAYDCTRLDALRSRLTAEGFDVNAAPSAPPAPVEDAAAPGQDAPPSSSDDSQPKEAAAKPPGPGECVYEGGLVEAVRTFQASRRLKVDGEVGSRTLERLNESAQQILATIDEALKRWRDKGAELTGNYILVNIPAFELAVFEGRREVMRMPVVVGQPDWPTPQMSETLEYLVLNPEWRIPDTIVEAEIQPKRKDDPNYFEREGIEKTADGKLRQKPGPRNPLGRIKFMMPNDEDIYLHDTPAKRHFQSSWRALSHGCIRVAQPLDLAAYLLSGDPQWTRERLQSAMDSNQTEEVKLPRTMPVHLVYIPAQVSAQGRLEALPDVYGQIGDREATPQVPEASDQDGFMPSYP